MTMHRVIDRDLISFLTSLSGFFLSSAGVVANVIGNQTNYLFWGFVVIGILVVGLGILMRLNENIFRALIRPFVGDNIISIIRCPDHYIETVCALAKDVFGDGVTSPDQTRSIVSRYKDSLQIALVTNDKTKVYVGGYYMLFPVQKSCVDRIIQFKFDVSGIQPDEIADRPDRGYAIYIGAILGTKKQVRAELMGALKMNIGLAEKTKSQTAYARAATKRGKQILLDYGFEPVHPQADGVGCFFRRSFLKEENKLPANIPYGIFSSESQRPKGEKTRIQRVPRTKREGDRPPLN